jgi:hypothetical protein
VKLTLYITESSEDTLDAAERLVHFRETMRIVKPDIERDPSCNFADDHDGPPDYTPVPPFCGKPATHLVVWADGRWSLGCDDHLGPFEAPAPHCAAIPLEEL